MKLLCPVLRLICITACVLVSALTQAAMEPADNDPPNAAMQFASLDSLNDADHNRDTEAKLSLAIGDTFWTEVSGGRSRSQQQSSTDGNVLQSTLFSAGFGVAGKKWLSSINFGSRQDGSSYKQRDWTASADWSDIRFGVAIDLMNRNTEINSVSHLVGPNGGTLDIPLRETAKGNGFGLRGHVNITEALNLFAGGMKYNYDTSTVQTGTVVVNGNVGGVVNVIVNKFLSNRPLLSQRLLTRASAVSRQEQILDYSYNVGVSYQFTHFSLTVEYLNDKPIDSDDKTKTYQLESVILIGEHWSVTPQLGVSATTQFGNVGFGGLSVQYAW